MLTQAEVVAIIRRVRYLDWSFALFKGRTLTGGFLMYTHFNDASGVRRVGRKWYISQHSCSSEVVQTCLLAVLTAVEHEAREAFTFDGQAIYGPHLDAEALLGVKHQSRVDNRVAPCDS